jgi:murein DD-endopeptidase MepM/ murein hydrolase activator NlpD
VIDPGAMTETPTPLSPLARLTPAADGNYYHVVQSGDTLSFIASLYGVSPAQLIAWNGLSAGAIIYPDQQLLLQVTPPAPPTATPGPATAEPTSQPTATATTSPTATRPPAGPTAAPGDDGADEEGTPAVLMYGAVLAGAGVVLLVGVFLRWKPAAGES